MNVTIKGQNMDQSVGGNEETRGNPIWELAAENNKKVKTIRKASRTYRPVPLT